ncbi:hypothetical protein [uncultured Chryseobacterium sp.]|uniref:hypothetical protein n=1 Tax=uncultured Chryseobacterium sp. TaxID=259322 RepID=UPI002588BA19|nr:hypothetical protein [uncultured Chryseobacterium sp.]
MMGNKVKILGIIILIVNIFLLIVSFFGSPYDTIEDREIDNINANSVLVLTVIFFITTLLSFAFIFINKLSKNKVIVYLMLFIGIFSGVELIRMLSFYKG